MRVLDPGHKYEIPNLEHEGCQRLVFIKRSSGMIQHKDEYPGSNTQEIIRVLIDRSIYLNSIQPCAETEDAISFLRLALYSYEVRAYRRKQEKLNKQAGKHVDEGKLSAHRTQFVDVPFTSDEIEKLPTGPDGHLIA